MISLRFVVGEISDKAFSSPNLKYKLSYAIIKSGVKNGSKTKK